MTSNGGLKGYIREGLIFYDLKAREKEGVLREISQHLARELGLQPDVIFSTLLDREKMGSTGIGDGIALPHGRIKNLGRPCVAVGISQNGVDFQAIDGTPVRIFVTLLTPEEAPAVHLGLLARLAKILRSPQFKERLLQAEGPDTILKLFLEEDRKIL